ncbi:MAG: hypothetical protein WAU77_07090 [Solirubrobacteraceae bacterium]
MVACHPDDTVDEFATLPSGVARLVRVSACVAAPLADVAEGRGGDGGILVAPDGECRARGERGAGGADAHTEQEGGRGARDTQALVAGLWGVAMRSLAVMSTLW